VSVIFKQQIRGPGNRTYLFEVRPVGRSEAIAIEYAIWERRGLFGRRGDLLYVEYRPRVSLLRLADTADGTSPARVHERVREIAKMVESEDPSSWRMERLELERITRELIDYFFAQTTKLPVKVRVDLLVGKDRPAILRSRNA
jgi:hypothetical protein